MRQYSSWMRWAWWIPAVAAALDALVGKGFDPIIAEAGRTQAQQDAKVAAGFSKTRKSKHVSKRYEDNRARAADIIERGKGWPGTSREFKLTLGRCAVRHGLEWGGLWFGKGPLGWMRRRRLEKFLAETPSPFNPNLYGGPLGLDWAHCEFKGGK